jgi:thioester reductase-like protein
MKERTTMTAPRLSGSVLITGATGFLGIHLLRALVDDSDAQVTCLVRGDHDRAAKARLWSALAWYFPELEPARIEQRIRVFAGDVTAEKLGLSDGVYDELAAQHDAIFNVAAEVRHVGAREHFFRMNTESLRALVDFSRAGTLKHLHHVSSVAVRGRFLETPSRTAFAETHLEEGQVFPDHPYAESKYRAELLLRGAFAQGARGTVYRVGNIGPHSRTGRFQQNIEGSDFAAYLRATTAMGIAPYRPHTTVRLTPVDAMARALLTLAANPDGAGRTYYVDSPREVLHYDVMRALHASGYAIRLIEAQHFAEQAVQLVQDDAALAMMLPAPSLEEGIAVPIDARHSEQELARLGFVYPEMSSGWLGKFIDHAIDVNFLAAPRHWRAGTLVRDLF